MSSHTDDKHYTGVLLEKIYDGIKTILEVVAPMQEKVNRIPRIEEDITEMKTDIKTIKLAVRYTDAQVKNHEQRITKLEKSKLSRFL
jgi:septal ring factor EnvC (AmiA/AmiB activator)